MDQLHYPEGVALCPDGSLLIADTWNHRVLKFPPGGPAGAGVPGGQVVGATDKDGGYITSSQAFTIEDYAATVYEKLGIDRHKPIYTPADRPILLSRHGQPIGELF